MVTKFIILSAIITISAIVLLMWAVIAASQNETRRAIDDMEQEEFLSSLHH